MPKKDPSASDSGRLTLYPKRPVMYMVPKSVKRKIWRFVSDVAGEIEDLLATFSEDERKELRLDMTLYRRGVTQQQLGKTGSVDAATDPEADEITKEDYVWACLLRQHCQRHANGQSEMDVTKDSVRRTVAGFSKIITDTNRATAQLQKIIADNPEIVTGNKADSLKLKEILESPDGESFNRTERLALVAINQRLEAMAASSNQTIEVFDKPWVLRNTTIDVQNLIRLVLLGHKSSDKTIVIDGEMVRDVCHRIANCLMDLAVWAPLRKEVQANGDS